MINFVPMATTFHELVDCRMVQLELEFHEASKRELSELGELCVLESNQLFSDSFFCQWRFKGRPLSIMSLQEKISECNGDFDFSFDADVMSNTVYNRKTFQIYDRLIQEESTGKWKDFSVSADYSQYFCERFSSIQTSEQYKEAIIQIMYEPRKRKNALWRQHDLSGSFMSHSYIENKSLYRGSFCLRVALNCLDNSAATFCDRLIEVVLKANSLFPNMSARIALSPLSSPAACSPHMMYFGGRVREDNTHAEMGVLGCEWYPYYFFCGAEWFNLLSPLQSSHLTDFDEKVACYDNLWTTVYPSGATLVQLKKTIDQIDVVDLMDVRQLLYKALYPGSSRINLADLRNPNAFGFLAKPRQEWECIPVFSNEIEVDKHCILFQHQ